MEKDSRLIDEFHACVNDPEAVYPICDSDPLLRSRNSETCGFRKNGVHTSDTTCTYCARAMTYTTADNLVNGMMQQPVIPPGPVGKVQKAVTDITPSTMFGLDNLQSMFGLSTNKVALNVSFGTCDNGDSAERATGTTMFSGARMGWCLACI